MCDNKLKGIMYISIVSLQGRMVCFSLVLSSIRRPNLMFGHFTSHPQNLKVSPKVFII
jgi:hypothetical protein